jgi:serine/threonine protein kinase/tetratricopeptide (TPR) repeat protein
MGVVYKARDKRLDRIVALKFLGAAQAERHDGLERFRREAQAIAKLNHPNVAVVYEIGEWDEEPFLALEYLPGGTLHDRIRGRKLGVEEILRIAMQLGAGLEFTHQHGILHRDIKPSNSMFSAHGDLKIVDFGLAKFAHRNDLTRPGAALGTIPYMAPEVLNGEPASIPSEVYSFGALIFELAAARPMYSAPTVEALCRKVLQDAPEPLSSVRPDLPSFLGEAVSHATARDPKDRPASIAAVLRELGAGSQTPVPASYAPTQTLVYLQARPRGKRTLLIGAVAIGLTLVGGAVPWLMHVGPFRGPVSPADQTVVVLPFENLSSDPASQTLTTGLQETVSSMLSRTGSPGDAPLVVPSVEVRRNQVHTISDARRLFNATLALSGTVQNNSDGMQITLALTDARTVRLKDSTIISVPADGAGLQNALGRSLAKLFPARALPAASAIPAGQATTSASAYALYVQGQGALNDRSYDQAVGLFQKAVDADPGFALARAKLALAHLRSYLLTKDQVSLAKGDAEANRAAEAGVTPDVLLVQALIRDATGDADRAIALFHQYQRAEPNDVEAYGLLAGVLNKAGRTQEAEATMQQAIRLRPGYWPTYERLGVFYLEQRQYEKSVHSFQTGIAIAPSVAALHYNLGAVYFTEDRWREAGAEFEKSLAIRPNALAYSNLGTVRFFEGKYQEAADQFQHATKLQPNNAINWGNLGDALWQLPKERAGALQAFQRAADLASEKLGLDASNDQLRQTYAIYLVKLGRKQEAVAEIKKALEHDPKDASVRFFAARVYATADMRSEALQALKDAVALGYSAGEISHEPDLAELRSDRTFQQLVAGRDNKQ